MIFKGPKIQSIISRLLIEEMTKPDCKAFVYIPGTSQAFSSHIDSVIQQYKTEIKISFIIDFLNNTDGEDRIYNLKVMKNILPLVLSTTNNYSFYYTYVKSIIDKSYITPYPYFIALSEKVICISADFDEAIIFDDINAAKNINIMCQGRIEQCKSLINIESDVHNIVLSLVGGREEVTTHYCIEYEPCLSMHFTKELIDAVIPKDLPMRKELLKLLFVRYEQLKKIKKSIQIFNKESIFKFAETGVVMEFPEGYSRPCTKEERLFILKGLLSMTLSDNHIIRAMNPVNLHISDCVSLIIQDDASIQFTMWNNRKTPLKYLALTEQSICKYYLDFMRDLLETNYLFSKEATVSFINDAIKQLDNKQA
ncbi:MAG: hypothetical protein LUC92_00490 [Clostridiales bacterium]|nr:hypothetical protein [Clostridiales bacterium]